MISYKIFKNDFLRKKMITLIIFVFIALSSFLATIGITQIVELCGSIDMFFKAAKVSDFMQMHTGKIDRNALEKWSSSNKLVANYQTVELLRIEGSQVYLGNNAHSEAQSIMNISIVKQNKDFDFLLDLHNKILNVPEGSIAVPVYFMEQNHLAIGDRVKLRIASFIKEYSISAFVRDAQMNPAIVHSKRFLVHEADFDQLKAQVPQSEYLIEFLIHDGDVKEFAKEYQASGMPKNGPTLDRSMFMLLNSISDKILAAAVMGLSALVVIIAMLCLRFMILASIEEDYKEIGVMKAIGIAQGNIKIIFLSKYFILGMLASVVGFLASRPVFSLLSNNIRLYSGLIEKSPIKLLLPIIGPFSITLIVILSCSLLMRRFDAITAINALNAGIERETPNTRKSLQIFGSRLGMNPLLAIKDVLQRCRLYYILLLVFFFCATAVLIPLHFMSTVESPTFITYLGIGKSDLRIDFSQSSNIVTRFTDIIAYIKSDQDIKNYSAFLTCRYALLRENGRKETIMIETGKFENFPLKFLEGKAPSIDTDIALSLLCAGDLGKKVGDTVTLDRNGNKTRHNVCGIYQDITNGGRTAKAMLEPDIGNAIRFSISLDLKPSVRKSDKRSEYAKRFYPSRVTDISDYLRQTLGTTIKQLRTVRTIAIFCSLFIAALVSALFLKMLIAKDAPSIAILRSLGFSLHDIRLQYLMRSISVLVAGIITGSLFANTVGQKMISFAWSFMGASRIEFVIDPIKAYLLYPVMLISCVVLGTFLGLRSMGKGSLITMILE